jgi:S-adenosylmethionine/arginine decarboxylase-like enzyme
MPKKDEKTIVKRTEHSRTFLQPAAKWSLFSFFCQAFTPKFPKGFFVDGKILNLIKTRHLLAEKMNREHIAKLDACDESHTYGRHVLAECELPALIDATMLTDIITIMARRWGATVAHQMHLQTESGRISGAVLLESHVICVQKEMIGSDGKKHVYFSVDGFSCGQKANPKKIVESIIEEVKATLIGELIDIQRDVLRYAEMSHETSLPEKFQSEIPYSHTMFGMCHGVALRKSDKLCFLKPTASSNSTEVCISAKLPDDAPSIAKHGIGQIYCSDPEITKNGQKLFQAILSACNVKKEDLLYYDIHQFDPEGASVVVIHKDFYLTMHPWWQLEYNIAPVDMFVFNRSSIDPVSVIQKLAKELDSHSYTANFYPRGSYNDKGELLPIPERFTSARDEPSQSSTYRV